MSLVNESLPSTAIHDQNGAPDEDLAGRQSQTWPRSGAINAAQMNIDLRYSDRFSKIKAVIRSYYQDFYFGSEHWAPWSDVMLRPREHALESSPLSHLVLPPLSDYSNPRALVHGLDLVVEMQACDRVSRSQDLLPSVLDELPLLIEQQHPQLIPTLLLLVATLQDVQRRDLFLTISKRMKERISTIFSSEHPLARAVAAISELHAEDEIEAVMVMIHSMFEVASGRDSHATSECAYLSLWVLIKKGDFSAAEAGLSVLRDLYPAHGLSNGDPRVRKAAFTTAQLYLATERSQQSEKQLEELLVVLETLSPYHFETVGTRSINAITFACLQILADIVVSRDKHMAKDLQSRASMIQSMLASS